VHVNNIDDPTAPPTLADSAPQEDSSEAPPDAHAERIEMQT
jgi:hypothetical protein